MLKRFICLANSYKEGGRCIAGIEVDENHQPLLMNGRPQWIRPVCETLHGEIPVSVARPFKVLDILEMQITESRAESFQTENVAFDISSLKAVGKFEKQKLEPLCDKKGPVFGSHGKAVSVDAAQQLNHSLLLIRTNNFSVIEKTYDDKPDKKQYRLLFQFNLNHYNFPVTDPVFIAGYASRKEEFKNLKSLMLCVSLGIEWEGWHYKLVATVID